MKVIIQFDSRVSSFNPMQPSYGAPYLQKVTQHIKEDLGCEVIVVSNSLVISNFCNKNGIEFQHSVEPNYFTSNCFRTADDEFVVANLSYGFVCFDMLKQVLKSDLNGALLLGTDTRPVTESELSDRVVVDEFNYIVTFEAHKYSDTGIGKRPKVSICRGSGVIKVSGVDVSILASLRGNEVNDPLQLRGFLDLGGAIRAIHVDFRSDTSSVCALAV